MLKKSKDPLENEVTLEQEDIPTRATAKKIYKSEKEKLRDTRNEFIPIIEPKQTIEIEVKPRLTREQIETIEKPASKKPKKQPTKTKKTKNTLIEKIEERTPNNKVKETLIKTSSKTENLKGNSILIITEKPQAAAKIAAALSKGRDKKYSDNGIPYYEFNRDGNNIIVACAVGHLFSLSQDVKGSSYPIFEVSWKPNFEVRKKDFTKK
ncbi:hypothetical protein FJZ17_04450, partial [Candidatus Pacearchaeota archaeon]|nr:hypothetical protein [Candidatus Pacearchaeota archaeon]